MTKEVEDAGECFFWFYVSMKETVDIKQKSWDFPSAARNAETQNHYRVQKVITFCHFLVREHSDSIYNEYAVKETDSYE